MRGAGIRTKQLTGALHGTFDDASYGWHRVHGGHVRVVGGRSRTAGGPTPLEFQDLEFQGGIVEVSSPGYTVHTCQLGGLPPGSGVGVPSGEGPRQGGVGSEYAARRGGEPPSAYVS